MSAATSLPPSLNDIVFHVLDPLEAVERDIFLTRAEAWYPDLLDGLTTLYGDAAEEEALNLLALAVRAYAERDYELRRLDLARTLDPAWAQHPGRVGYAAYTERFAGTLRGVEDRIDYLRELGVTYLHLMPLLTPRPGDSDGGYAVADYRTVRPDLGTMEDLEHLAGELRAEGISLVVDLVLNHVAAEHEWAVRARAGEQRYRDYFLIFPDRTEPDAYERTLPEVFPDFAPGNFTWDDGVGGWVWTTFNSFQWDLNWRNPHVMAEFAGIVLNLANRGVEVLRLDAIAFTIKRKGTDCQGQPEVHAITEVLRAITRIATTAVDLKAEAIVAPTELLQYLGQGRYTGKVPHGPDLVHARHPQRHARRTRPGRAARRAAHRHLDHLHPLPRRHRLGHRRRRRRGGRAQRLLAPRLPGRLVPRDLPHERRPRPGLPVQPGHQRPSHRRYRREPHRHRERRRGGRGHRRVDAAVAGGGAAHVARGALQRPATGQRHHLRMGRRAGHLER